MPPIHPALVHFPVALGVVSVVSDTVAALFGVSSLYAVGQWAMAGAAAGAALAILAGHSDMKRDALQRETHEIVHLHLKIGWSVGIALLALAVWRWLGGMPGPAYLVAAWLAAALLMLQAWLGGEMVYAHGAGVAATGQGTEPPEKAQRSSLRFYRVLTGKSAKTHNTSHGEHSGGTRRP